MDAKVTNNGVTLTVNLTEDEVKNIEYILGNLSESNYRAALDEDDVEYTEEQIATFVKFAYAVYDEL